MKVNTMRRPICSTNNI